MKKQISDWADTLTDWICFASFVGLWPRFIEPKWLKIQTLALCLPRLPYAFQGFKIAHLSDLHLNDRSSLSLLSKVKTALQAYEPDLICFTGDFLCYSQLPQDSKLKQILQTWVHIAPVVACLGNHDYCSYVTQRNGLPQIKQSPSPFLIRALKRLMCRRRHTQAQDCLRHNLKANDQLVATLKEIGVNLLQNNSFEIFRGSQKLSILGLEDLWACSQGLLATPSMAEVKAHIILAHNPDTIELLHHMPPALVLSGHTHGGNINLPWISQKMRSVCDSSRLSGLHRVQAHRLYINRGLGNPYPLRLFARPELTFIELRHHG